MIVIYFKKFFFFWDEDLNAPKRSPSVPMRTQAPPQRRGQAAPVNHDHIDMPRPAVSQYRNERRNFSFYAAQPKPYQQQHTQSNMQYPKHPLWIRKENASFFLKREKKKTQKIWTQYLFILQYIPFCSIKQYYRTWNFEHIFNFPEESEWNLEYHSKIFNFGEELTILYLFLSRKWKYLKFWISILNLYKM